MPLAFPDRARRSWRRGLALAVALLALPGTAPVWSAAAAPIVVTKSARPPYVVRRAAVEITVGRGVSHVVADYEFIYVKAFDAQDGNNPMFIDVPVIMRTEDVSPGRVQKIAQAQVQHGRQAYQARDVLLLDHAAVEPVPLLPDGARVAIVVFNIPRQNLKPRFKVRVTYDQPHVTADGGGEWCGVVPLLPDLEHLEQTLRFKPGDLRVTFTALPGVRLRRDSVNARVVTDSAETVTVHPRDREVVSVIVEGRATP